MASFKLFSLKGQGLKLDTAADIEPHIQPLKDDDEVEEIRLQGNTLGVEASIALAEVLKTKKKLQIANLADIFTSRLLSEIPPALSSLLTAFLELPNLHTINLSDNAFGLNTQEPLVSFLSQHTPLQHLYLNNNGMGPIAGTLIANALTTLAKKKETARKEGKTVPQLETTVCGRNRLESGSMVAWAKCYQANNGVKFVKMVQNGIRQEGIVALLRDGLRHAKDLETLDLQDNTFTETGARALAEVAGGWSRIKELAVSDCYLRPRGAVILAQALGKGQNKQLEVLRMQYNDLNARGVQAFVDAATEGLPKLRRVEINGNKFDEDDPAVDALRELLHERKGRKGLHFEARDDEDWGLDELDELEDDTDEDVEELDDEVEKETNGEKDEAEERILKDAEEEEEKNVPEEADKKVDELADMLEKKLNV